MSDITVSCVSLPRPAMRTLAALLVAIGTATFGAATAHASANLLVNGDFDQFTDPAGATPNTSYQLAKVGNSQPGASLAGWGNYGYGFVYTPGSADTTGAITPEFGNGTTLLWGPGGGTSAANYSNNGLTPTSPTGGNYVVEDGSYEPGVLFQTVNNLTVGSTYQLSFYWAAAQQYGASFTQPTTENFTVYWADANYNVTSSFVTQTDNTPGEGFTPWQRVTTSFVATTTSETLAFLAGGTPSGEPPFSLLDGVSLTATPEPATWAVVMVGLVGVSVMGYVRRRTGPSAQARTGGA